MQNAIIVASGMYVPECIISNQYFNESLGQDVDTWLREKVHIYERRWCADNESTADLCEHAALEALNNANLTASDLDLIIIATDTPEFISPSTASVVQDRLKATNAGTFDINTACAGFVTGIDIGAKYIKSDEYYKNVLVIGAYAMSKHLNKKDKKTVTLFADGAGAVILQAEKNSERGFLSSQLISEGQYNSWMGVYGGGTHQPVTQEVLKNHDHQLKFVHKFPSELNPQIWSKMAQTLCERIGANISDVDHFFITQININSIWETLNLLNVPHKKAHTIMHNYGYTGSACIPMAFHHSIKEGQVKKGDLVFFIGSGGGLAFASAAFRM